MQSARKQSHSKKVLAKQTNKIRVRNTYLMSYIALTEVYGEELTAKQREDVLIKTNFTWIIQE